MKSILTAFLIAVGASAAFAQETLQTVLSRGKDYFGNGVHIQDNYFSNLNLLSEGYKGVRLGYNNTNGNGMIMPVEGQGLGFDIATYQNGLLSTKFTVLNSGNVGIGTTNPISRLTVSGQENLDPSLFIQNTSYSSTDAIGTASLRFAFLNHYGPKIEAYKVTNNTTGLKFYTEFGYNISQLGMIIQPSSDGPLVGIGTATPKEKLSVNGKIRAHEVKVETANWPDYVFEEGYDVGTLEKLESYIKVNKHLPEVPSAKEVEANGVELSEMNKILLKKLEELTLHLIEKEKEIEHEKNVNKKQEGRLIILEEFIKNLKNQK